MSPTPPPQPLTKRDKRRNNITERLQDMITTFGKDQHQHYRAQLQAIQVEMTLILRADPYENAPLDDSPQAIEDLIETVTSGNLPAGKAARDDYLAMAGRRYYEYCQEINKAQEQRDADLTALKNKYDSANAQLDRSHSYKVQVAQREHYELASTIRQRLINNVTKKRDRLLREKEQLDIADSNSMFLHPSHFSINVPASPGGIHSNRKTRHTRHRVGDPEENQVERGRKRKVPGDDDGNDSPVPGFRSLANDGNGGASPYYEQRAKTLYGQHEAPAYSIERLFTEKELAHATTIAQFATHKFFLEQQQGNEAASALTNGEATGVPSIDGSAGAVASTTITNPDEDEIMGGTRNGASPPPSQAQATDMERQVSYHATRGATKANPLSFLSEAAEALSAVPPTSNPNRFLPAMVPITKTDKGAPTPPSMATSDVDSDLALIMTAEDQVSDKRRTNGHGNNEEDDEDINTMRTKYLEQACRELTGLQPFRLPLTEVGPAYIRDGANRPPNLGFADAASVPNGIKEGVPAPTSAANLHTLAAALRGAEPMSRATSQGGMSEMGASEVGGVGMRRTRSRLI